MTIIIRQIAKAIIYHEGKFLLQLRDNRPDIAYPNCWSFFGGEIESEETPWQALQREVEEELEWRPLKGSFLYKRLSLEEFCCIHFFDVFFTGNKKKLVLNEGQALGWFTMKNIDQNDAKFTHVRQHLIHYMNRFG